LKINLRLIFFSVPANTSQYAHYVFSTLDQSKSGFLHFEVSLYYFFSRAKSYAIKYVGIRSTNTNEQSFATQFFGLRVVSRFSRQMRFTCSTGFFMFREERKKHFTTKREMTRCTWRRVVARFPIQYVAICKLDWLTIKKELQQLISVGDVLETGWKVYFELCEITNACHLTTSTVYGTVEIRLHTSWLVRFSTLLCIITSCSRN
jgi:hypothetical protein